MGGDGMKDGRSEKHKRGIEVCVCADAERALLMRRSTSGE